MSNSIQFLGQHFSPQESSSASAASSSFSGAYNSSRLGGVINGIALNSISPVSPTPTEDLSYVPLTPLLEDAHEFRIEKIKRLEMELGQLSAQKTGLENQLTQAQENLTTLTTRNLDLEHKIKELTRSSKTQSGKLKAEKSGLEKKLNDVTKLCSELASGFKSHIDQLTKALQENVDLARSNRSLSAKIQELEKPNTSTIQLKGAPQTTELSGAINSKNPANSEGFSASASSSVITSSTRNNQNDELTKRLAIAREQMKVYSSRMYSSTADQPPTEKSEPSTSLAQCGVSSASSSSSVSASASSSSQGPSINQASSCPNTAFNPSVQAMETDVQGSSKRKLSDQGGQESPIKHSKHHAYTETT